MAELHIKDITEPSDIIFENRECAEQIKSEIISTVKLYKTITMRQYLNLAGFETVDQDEIVYWTDEDLTENSVEVEEVPGGIGYRIVFPNPRSTTLWSDIPDDPVNHPDHYQSKSGLETIQVIEAFTEDCVGMEAVYTGNILKYVCRWKKKNGLEDLKKAQWYLNHLIDYVEKEKK